ncbi:MAG TPA: hypothetical protein VJ691_10445, partial [Vicinamibacterales bacterium]|nr:hypothetical protein [Vicinamibacterales bacterium]
MRLTAERVLVGAMLVLALITLGLQAFVLRPHLWPAGAGLALSGDTVFGALAAPPPVAVIRPPDGNDWSRATKVMQVRPGGPAERAGVHEGDHVVGAGAEPGPYNMLAAVTPDPSRVWRVWRDVQQMPLDQPLHLTILRSPPGAYRGVIVERPAIWAIDDARGAWVRAHLGPLAQMTAFLAGAAVLLVLGAHGVTATLAMLALIATAAANGGPL